MTEDTPANQPVQASDNSIAVGSIAVGGSFEGNLIIGNTGLNAEQVSTLLAQISATFQPKPFDGRCPYKGLDFFDEEDAELYFGREKLVTEIINRVKESRTIFITGPSGSGKSSLIRAGLLHALKQGAIKESKSDRWLYATMKPGRDPLEALASVFSRLKSPELGNYFKQNVSKPNLVHECAESALSERNEQRLVLFIDQFEEVFTQLNTDKAGTFIELLANAAMIENGRVIILFAMRSDFVSNCATYPKLNMLLNRQFVQIGAMGNDELVSAIAQPALRVGLRIDPDLIAQIINDMQGEPGALPLMQFALKDLFEAEQAKGGVIALVLTEYFQRGGIRKALERHADNSFNNLNENEKEIARSIFSSLIEIGRGTQDTRRTVIYDELFTANARAEDVKAIVQKLADARLITTDEMEGKDTVTISHEKLIDAWPWLKKLVNENRDVIALQNEISEDAKEWDEHNRDASYLYSGARLINAREQLANKTLTLSNISNDFVLESILRQQYAQRTKALSIAGIVGLIVMGILLFSFLTVSNSNKLAEQSKNAANTQAVIASTAQANANEALMQAKISRSGELAALALSEQDKHFDLAQLFSLESIHTFENSRTLGTLLSLTNSHPGLEKYLPASKGEVTSVAFSPNGNYLASGNIDHTVTLWNLSEPNPPAQLSILSGHSDAVTSVAFSQNGLLLASGSEDHTAILWDIREPTAPVKLATLSGHSDSVASVAFSPDGKFLASAGGDAKIILWNISNPKAPIQASILSGHKDWVSSVAFSLDGRHLASGSWDDQVILWDVSNPAAPVQLSILAGHTNAVSSVAFSPNGNYLVSGSNDDTVILWNISDPSAPTQLAVRSQHRDAVTSVAFSLDGKHLASGSWDTTIILWDVSDPSNPVQIATLSGHSDWVTSVAFGPDSKHLASGARDTHIILWNVETLTNPSQTAILPRADDPITSVAFSQVGNLLASGSGKNIILSDISNPNVPRQLTVLSSPNFFVSCVAFSPNGRLLASGSGDLWDVSKPTSPTHLASLSELNDSITSVAFNTDGKLLATGSGKNVTLWNISDPTNPVQLTTLHGHNEIVRSVVFSPDGKYLASGSDDQTVVVWDVNNPTTPTQLATLKGHSLGITSLAFSPDGNHLASGSYDNSIIVWDTKSQQRIAVLSVNSKPVSSIAFSPDGKQLASGSSDNTITLWDVSDLGISQFATLSGPKDSVNSIAFSPDGKLLASGDADQNIILWDIDPQSWIKKTCQRVGRNFTRAEWVQYFPNNTYRATCPDLPVEP